MHDRQHPFNIRTNVTSYSLPDRPQGSRNGRSTYTTHNLCFSIRVTINLFPLFSFSGLRLFRDYVPGDIERKVCAK